MGASPHVGYERFPRQGTHLGMPVRVCFDHAQRALRGEVVRDDVEAPWLTIIRLNDGRHVLGAECQWTVGGT